jgi:hypothetical protein
MASYSFALLDPRPIPAAEEANAKVFAIGPVLGVEVTVSQLAARCVLGNIDPQHSGGNAGLAAIEAAMTAELPPEGATLATVRPDLDSVGGMAIIAMRARGENLAPVMERVRLVAEADKFARGGYPGPKPLPTRDTPWSEESTASESRSLAAIAAAVMDFKVGVADRVRAMEVWLLSGEEPASYRAQVERERTELIRALETGEISHRLAANGRIAVVESTHRAATSVGYSLAPVVVALNPTFRLGTGEPHRKFTICQYAGGFADIKAALAELNKLEPGWGGSPTIGGSPQGVSSTLTTDKVVEVVRRHIG